MNTVSYKHKWCEFLKKHNYKIFKINFLLAFKPSVLSRGHACKSIKKKYKNKKKLETFLMDVSEVVYINN